MSYKIAIYHRRLLQLICYDATQAEVHRIDYGSWDDLVADLAARRLSITLKDVIFVQ